METWIGIVSTLNVVLLGWLALQINEIKKEMKDKANIKDIDKCRRACDNEQKETWERVNRHKHSNTGEVIIPQ